MATIRTFDPLAAAQVELAQRRQATGGDPLSSLIQGLTQGVQVAQMPQQLASQALMSQVKTALAQQQLQDLQNPEAALQRKIREAIAIRQASPVEVAGSLAGINPVTGKYETLYTAPRAASSEAIRYDPNTGRQLVMVNGQLVARQVPLEETMGMAPSVPVSIPDVSGIGLNVDPSLSFGVTPSQAPATTDLPEILLPEASRFLGGTLEQRANTAEEIRKENQAFRTALQEDAQTFRADQNLLQREYLKGKSESSAITPAQRITAQREVRNTYDGLPAKLDFFGKGQVPGSDQLKTRLDAVLKPVNSDFNKLTGTGLDTFVFALNKLRDPTSATLLAEASQIAARAGIADRFGAYIENVKSGKQVSPQVAKDIYDVISQVHSAHKENFINSLIPLKEDMDDLGKSLTSIGVPKYLQDEVENRINNLNNSQGGTAPTGAAPKTAEEFLSQFR